MFCSSLDLSGDAIGFSPGVKFSLSRARDSRCYGHCGLAVLAVPEAA